MNKQYTSAKSYILERNYRHVKIVADLVSLYYGDSVGILCRGAGRCMKSVHPSKVGIALLRDILKNNVVSWVHSKTMI